MRTKAPVLTPEGGFSGASYRPEGVEPQVLYDPKGDGAEARVRERLERWRTLPGEREGSSEHGR